MELLLLVSSRRHERADLATAVAPVSSALCPGQDDLAGHPLAVRRQAQVAHDVDEARGQVQLAAELAGRVVVRKRVVVVVEPFAWKKEQQPRYGDETRKSTLCRTPVTHQQEAYWAVNAMRLVLFIQCWNSCIPIVYRPRGDTPLFRMGTDCVHSSHLGQTQRASCRSHPRNDLTPAATRNWNRRRSV